ncbi:hypothetical protein MAMC_01388 [Methylacidimicrobium cyclopophantes]|uniref:Uncharacterized protein n=1 Tax=Methylacidimicrobium cyclopophantes TaxID=1041766 RepID=A0A5E6MFH7_9BACT|nr:hypothetical protein [Methylacidimicrobium cyclopophantes]VVM06991.1 hypothetical protein MAMC_01388 [Methylacidimicrobium cyclopophantes]
MPKKEEGIRALETLLSGDYCPILFAVLSSLITASPEFVHEFKDQLLSVLELYAEKLEGDRLRLWATMAKPLVEKEPRRVCLAAIKACKGHPYSFRPDINPRMFPLIPLLELLWNDPQARELLIEAAQTGQGGPLLPSWVKHKMPTEEAPMQGEARGQKKQQEEDILRRLFDYLGCRLTQMSMRESPDFIAEIARKRIGIEVTILHPGEKETGGSPLRRQEEEIVRRNGPEQPYGMWASLDWKRALQRRIEQKVRRAKRFNRSSIDKLWLVVAAAVPTSGAVVSTCVLGFDVTAEKLCNLTAGVLEESVYDLVFFYIIMEKKLFRWKKGNSWKEVRQRRNLSTGELA